MKKTKLFIDNKPANINIFIADNFLNKTIGLMFTKNQSNGLLIPSCKSIHTFFMRYSINVVSLGSDNTVLCVYSDLRPWKILLAKGKTKNILELPAHLMDISKIRINSKLSFYSQ